MLTLMLDPHFKSFDAMKTFVGHAKVIQMMVEYDNKILLPLLVVAFQFLNPYTNGLLKQHHWWQWQRWLHRWGNDFKWGHFVHIAKKWIMFIPPFACEVERFYIAFDLVEVHESWFSNIFVVQQIQRIHSWVLNQDWKDFQHNWNINKPLVWIYNLAWWIYWYVTPPL